MKTKKKTKKKIKILRLFLVFAIIFLMTGGFILADVVIDNRFEERVLNGRQMVDDFRVLHDAQYVKGVKVKDYETQEYFKMIENMTTIGYNRVARPTTIEDVTKPIYDFFDESNDYNAQQLGFDDFDDYIGRATSIDRTAFDSLWK